MANGIAVADVAGAFERGRQFRQAEQLRPLQRESAGLALQQQEQNLAFGERRNQQVLDTGTLTQTGLQQQIDQRTDTEKNKSLFNAALRVGSATDEEIIPILEAQIEKVNRLGGNSKEAMNALQLANQGDFDTIRSRAKNLIEIGVRQGDIKAPTGSTIKPTSSKQDFDVFKQLNEKAQRTQDPVDIQLAKAFGVQSGFDRLSPQELADIDVEKESRKTLGKQAAVASKEAFDSLKNVRRTIANMDDAIKALDGGAETGPIVSKLPSFRQASIELDNIKGRMGLDVISSVSFGALSESELAFALDTALPTNLEPVALREWLVEKKRVQGLLANELRKAASFLGTPGNTIADYIAKQEKENPNPDTLSDDELKKRLGL